MDETINYSIRPVFATDESFLWRMLYYAADLDRESGKTVADAMQDPILALYVVGWGRFGDLGFLACDSNSHLPLGAAWARLHDGEKKAYSATESNTPEIATAVLPHIVGHGIGTALLKTLIEAAQSNFPALALNVRANNPALRLYERLGFTKIGTMVNRAGALSYDMRLYFSS